MAMISLIFGIIFIVSLILILGTTLFKKSMSKNDFSTGNSIRQKAIFAAVISLALAILSGGIRVVDVGHSTLVKQFGQPVSVLSPGLHFIKPVINSTTDYSTRNLQIDMDFTAYSFDAQNMTIHATVQYEIAPQRIIDIANRFGDNNALEARISRVAEEKIKTVLSSKSATKIIETREELAPELLKSMGEIENDYYVNVITAIAPSITFSPEFESAVENKMKAEQTKLQANYDKETAIIKAEQQLEVAKRDAESAIAKAQGDAEALAIMTGAWVSISQSVKDAMIRQQFIEKWDGKMPQVVSDGNMIYDLGLTGTAQSAEEPAM